MDTLYFLMEISPIRDDVSKRERDRVDEQDGKFGNEVNEIR